MEKEAEAFDAIIQERVAGGFKADLKNAVSCDYFYNNVWRRPYMAQKHFGAYVDFITQHVLPGSILEVGCGSGFVSLELARAGFDVLGIDISKDCIEIAKTTAGWANDLSGKLNYRVADFFDGSLDGLSYDNIVFVGTLHHIANQYAAVESVIKHLIDKRGRVIIIEPAREQFTQRDAWWIAFIRILLSAYEGWYEDIPIPKTLEEFKSYSARIYREFSTGHDVDDNEQSPNDNASDGKTMLRVFGKRFKEIAHQKKPCFFPRIAGGIRGLTEDKLKKLTQLFYLFDNFAVNNGLLTPDGFMWAGELEK